MMSGLCDRLGPIRMVQCVRVELSLQGNTTALSIVDSVFAGLIQKVACVNLNAGAVRMNGHGTPRYWISKNGAGIAEYFPVMVIACLKVQRLIVRTDVLRNGFGRSEIHRCAVYFTQLSCGNVCSIIRTEEPARKNQNLIHGLIRVFVTGKIEIAVVGHVKDCIHIGYRIILNVKPFVIQCVCYLDDRISGEPLISIGTLKLKGDGRISLGNNFP